MSDESDFYFFWIVPVFGFPFAITGGLASMLAFGPPLHTLLFHLKLRGWVMYCLGGATAGGIIGALISLLASSAPWFAGYSLVCGLGMGATF